MFRSSDNVHLMFKAFADPTRLRLMRLLARKKELCVCDLKDAVGLSQPKISRHLAYLRRAGLVEQRKQGLWRYYRLSEPSGRFHRKLIACLGECFGEVEFFGRDLRRLGKTSTARVCR